MQLAQILVLATFITGLGAYAVSRFFKPGTTARIVVGASGVAIAVISAGMASLPGILPPLWSEASPWTQAAIYFAVLFVVIAVGSVKEWHAMRDERHPHPHRPKEGWPEHHSPTPATQG